RQVLFESIEERVEASQRLRFDLCVFRDLCRDGAERLAAANASVAMVQPLRRFALEFRDVAYQLLRHSDRELFDRFLEIIQTWGADALDDTPDRVQRVREDCRRFAEVLERAVENVSKRADLKDRPLDERQVREALARRLSAV
ncbi:MAG TPA: hypothetical protein VG496_05485, partial [Myxococcales bacterium]|nr:hypothetical protein [Myxococcales bacterium]